MPSSARLACFAALVLWGCEEKPAGPPPERFAGVKKTSPKSTAAFCEKVYPGTGSGARRFAVPPLRPLGEAASLSLTAGWTWVNVWATWCGPCVEEMGLLLRWRDALAREGFPVTFALLSIDEEESREALEGWRKKRLPGPIHWLRGEDDVGPLLHSLGVDRNASIPIHVLIDGGGQVRCVRVGAIHEHDYGAVRALLAGG